MLLLALGCAAQTVRLANHSGVLFDGWKRTTVDTLPANQSGRVGDTTYVIGRRCGLDLWIVDLRCRLEPGQRLSLDLAASQPVPFVRAPLPADIVAHFGGPATIAGVPMEIASLQADGAGYTAHLRARVGRLLNIDQWITWYPDQPAFAHAEAVITASNPKVPDISVQVPFGFHLRFGDALFLPLGGAPNSPLIAEGTTFFDGQARCVPLTWVWLRHLQSASTWSSVGAAANWAIGAVGISKLLPDGNPRYPLGYDGLNWARGLLPEAIRRIHTWEPGVCGPFPLSGITGHQEDQAFVRGEPMLPNGCGAEIVAYLSGLRLLSRPNHNLEIDGKQIAQSAHPNLVYWAGRPHFNHVVSPDRLGKTVDIEPPMLESQWAGPDRQHDLYCTVMAGFRYTGSPALQWEMETQARVWLFSETIPSMKPGWSTNGYDSARSVGWAGIKVTELWFNLEDRVIANAVAERWRQRVLQVYIPQIGSQPGDIWQVFIDDPRVGPGPWWLVWQQSIGSYGLDLGCRVLGPPEGCQMALRAARAVLAHGFVRQDPTTLATLANDGTPLTTVPWRDIPGVRWTHTGKLPTDPYVGVSVSAYDHQNLGERWYFTTWDVPALAVVLRYDPTNVRARSIFNQSRDSLGGPNDRWSWFPPGVN